LRDLSDEHWSLVLPYLLLSREDNKSRVYALHEVFNAVRYVMKSGNQLRSMPSHLPPWRVVYQQMRRCGK
jgi:transposase